MVEEMDEKLTIVRFLELVDSFRSNQSK